MMNYIFEETGSNAEQYSTSLRSVLARLETPFHRGDSIAIKLHWGERGNRSFLPPLYARAIATWLREQGMKPFVFDTTVLYSGGRRTAAESLQTAAEHGYTEEYLGCPIVIGDGPDGRDTVDIDASYKHFDTAQVTALIDRVDGFFIFSHFKGHMASGFGGAIKNLSMGFASRAQKQRMHADVFPVLDHKKCTRCGICVEVCPTGAAAIENGDYPAYDPDRCIGCAQCIAMCPEMALKILWSTDRTVFLEKLVETAGAIWKRIDAKTVFVNALLSITAECDCLPGKNPVILEDQGFIGGYHPVAIDEASIRITGGACFSKTHPDVPWEHQFSYAREIGFSEADSQRRNP